MSLLHPSIRRSLRALLAGLVAGVATAPHAGVLYEDPENGWDYLFDGDFDARGSQTACLDGSWSRDEATQWSSFAPGIDGFVAPNDPPGGVDALLDGETTYLRIQDTGVPSEWGYPDPSNRRFWFARDVELEHPGMTSVVTNGITITFRARLSSTGVLDDVHPQLSPDIDPEQPQLTVITPWFVKGYNVTDDGQGMFTVQENGVTGVGFALAMDFDTPAGVGSGLVMNNKPGAGLSGSDHTVPAFANLLPLSEAELVDWHEFWITLVGTDPPGNYDIDIYRDGGSVPASFVAQPSDGAEYPGQQIAMGLSATSGYSAVDVDFFAYKLGVVQPAPEPSGAAAAFAAVGALAIARRRTATISG